MKITFAASMFAGVAFLLGATCPSTCGGPGTADQAIRGHEAELAALRLENAELKARLGRAEAAAPALSTSPTSRSPTREDYQNVMDELQASVEEAERLAEDNSSLQQRIDALEADLAYLRGRAGEQEWELFLQDPRVDDLPPDVLEEAHNLFRLLGSPLSVEQVQGLAPFLLEYRDRDADWNRRFTAAYMQAGGNGRDPSLASLHQEKEQFARQHDEMLRAYLPEALVRIYLGQ